MAIKLRKLERANPQNRVLKKWYLTQESSGSVGMHEIAKDIEGRSSLSLGDIQSTLSNMVEVLPIFLKLGQSVKLEGFGTFRLSVTSDGVDKPEDLSAHHVKSTKIVFLPSPELKRSLGDITFEVIH